jgi:hypothetical protein
VPPRAEAAMSNAWTEYAAQLDKERRDMLKLAFRGRCSFCGRDVDTDHLDYMRICLACWQKEEM